MLDDANELYDFYDQKKQELNQEKPLPLSKEDSINSSKGIELAQSAISETTLNGCNRIRKSIIETCNLADHGLPTLHYATKHHVPIESEIMTMPEKHMQLKEEYDQNIVKKGIICNNNSIEDAPKKVKEEKPYCAEIEGGAEKYLDLTLDKLTSLRGNNWTISEANKSILVLILVDGARYQVIIERDANAI